MGSSGGGSANPAYLSQGGNPIPNLPIAGQGAPNDNPRNFGSFQSFLPDIPPAGQGPAPLARGLTAEMLQFKSPQGVATPTGGGGAVGATGAAGAAGGDASQIDAMKQQIAQLQSQAGNGQFGAARSGSGGMQWVQGSRGSGSATDGWQPSEMGRWQPTVTS